MQYNDNNICNTLKLKGTHNLSHPMVPWDREPCILPTLLLQTYTLYNRHLLPRQVQVDKFKKANPSRQTQIGKYKFHDNKNFLTIPSTI